MQSPKSSVGSRSSNCWKDINQQLRCHQENEGVAEVLQSSWIRRLNLKPTSPIVLNKDDPPSVLPTIAVNSSSTNGSGATVLCHRTTISTDESQTPTSIINGRTTSFFHQLLKNRKEKRSLKTDPENCSFHGFEPFQIKTGRTLIESPDKVTSLGEDDDDQFIHNCSEIQGGNGDLGQDVRWKFNYNGNSCENVCSQIVEEEGYLTSNKKVGSLQKRKVGDDDQNRIPQSPFSPFWSASKKNEYLRENTSNQNTIKNVCISGSSVEQNNKKFINPSSKALVEGDQRRRHSVDQWPMYSVSHGISSLSRIGGISCHESHDGDDNAAGRICKDPRFTHHNAVLNQYERHAPPAYPNETGEPPSSFWKMNSFQRAEMVSSIFRARRTSTRKRIPDSEEFVSLKSRKLDLED